MFEQTTLETPEIKEGSIVKGVVVDIIGDYAVVDVGLKAEGQVPLREFREEDESGEEGAFTEPLVNVGDEVEVLLETAEDQNGLVVLSKEKARKRKVWDEISKAVEQDGLVVGTITERQAPVLRRVYDQMPDPKWVLAFGVCASTGGFYQNYTVMPGA
ncbi:MAG: S1 RNA-binding domain-containing protein, partial [Myxococcales bacterium]|nr:S1 RNA-binding domain-containing protein [Myxococcales bacterium]